MRNRTQKDLQRNGVIDSNRHLVPTFEYLKLKYKLKPTKKKKNFIDQLNQSSKKLEDTQGSV